MATLSLLATRPLDGALKELTALQLAEAALARGTAERVEPALARLTLDKLANPEDVWLMRARVEDAAGIARTRSSRIAGSTTTIR